MVAVSVSGHGVVFMVPMGPKALTRGDIIEIPDKGYWMITGMDLLGPGQYRIRAIPALGKPLGNQGNLNDEIAWHVDHGEFVHVMKARR